MAKYVAVRLLFKLFLLLILGAILIGMFKVFFPRDKS